MSITEVLIKVGGAFLFIVGIALCLSVVIAGGFLGFTVSTAFPIWGVILVGVLFICGGVVLIRGGNITP